MSDYRIVDTPPAASTGAKNKPIADWVKIAKMAAEASPGWVEVRNVHRQHAAAIVRGEKAPFRAYPGTWKVTSRRLEGDDDKKATLYIQHLPI